VRSLAGPRAQQTLVSLALQVHNDAQIREHRCSPTSHVIGNRDGIAAAMRPTRRAWSSHHLMDRAPGDYTAEIMPCRGAGPGRSGALRARPAPAHAAGTPAAW
jgi:hypothetical protein